MKQCVGFLLAVALVLSFSSANSAPIRDLVVEHVSDPTVIDRRAFAALTRRYGDSMKRHTIARLDPHALNTDHREIPYDGDGNFDWCMGETAMVSLFPKLPVLIKNIYVDEAHKGLWTWAGRLSGDDSSHAVLIFQKSLLKQGTISSSILGSYQIHHLHDDLYLIFEENSRRNFVERATSSDEAGLPDGYTKDPNPVSLEDLLFSRSQSSATIRVGGFATGAYPLGRFGAELDLANGIATTNLSLIASASPHQFQFAGTVYEVLTVDEVSGSSFNVRTLHGRINGDRHPAVTALRNNFAADVMVGFGLTDDFTCGIASTLVSLGGQRALGYAGIARRRGGAECGGLSTAEVIAHELGHLLGGQHVNEGTGLFPYSRGYILNNMLSEATLMVGGTECLGCSRLTRFSNPATPYGDPLVADNIRTFNASAPIVASYRTSSSTLPRPNLNNVSVLNECVGATVFWNAPSSPVSEYNVRVNNSLAYRGGSRQIKVPTSVGVWNTVEVTACLGDKCDLTPPARTFFVPNDCISN